MHKVSLAIFLGAFSFAAAAHVDCNNALTTDEINTCARVDLSKAEARLYVAYKRALKVAAHTSATARSSLVLAQAAWVKYRAHDCVAVRSMYDGGHEAPIYFNSCMASHTVKRASELEEFSDAFD